MATVDFGPVVCGQRGMVIRRDRAGWRLWRRTAYCCTFLGGITVTTRRDQIAPHDHGWGRRILEDPYWFLHTRDHCKDACRFVAERPRLAR